MHSSSSDSRQWNVLGSQSYSTSWQQPSNIEKNIHDVWFKYTYNIPNSKVNFQARLIFLSISWYIACIFFLSPWSHVIWAASCSLPTSDGCHRDTSFLRQKYLWWSCGLSPQGVVCLNNYQGVWTPLAKPVLVLCGQRINKCLLFVFLQDFYFPLYSFIFHLLYSERV